MNTTRERPATCKEYDARAAALYKLRDRLILLYGVHDPGVLRVREEIRFLHSRKPGPKPYGKE